MVQRRTTIGTSSLTIALIYTRVSSEEQAREGVSLDAQLAECRRYAAQHGWLLGHEYQDVLTGKRDDRPQYQALLTDVRQRRAAGESVVVVVVRLDRFGRRVLERVRCREELKVLGVATHSVREGGEVSDLVANILASVAEEEVRQLEERISIAKQYSISAGWYHGGRVPWGYFLRTATAAERLHGAPRTVLDVNSLEVSYVREFFARAASGPSIRQAIRWAKALPAAARGERNMTYQPLIRLLHSPVYVGRMMHGTGPVLERSRAAWPALVDDETWSRVQERFAAHQHVPHQGSQQYLLTGFLRCPRCGTRMSAAKAAGL